MKIKPYKIHFVCHGNTFRSRLAAAYFADIIGDDRYEISSSGTRAEYADSSVIEPFTAVLARKHGLSYQLRKPHTQTTAEFLADADIIICMKDDIFRELQMHYGLDARKALVWHISDIPDDIKPKVLADGTDAAMLAATEPIFQRIQKQCDDLRGYLTRGSWVDVVDKSNHPTGLRLPISMVSDRGLWHRGVRVVVQTSDGKFVVEKRSQSMVYGPGMLEIGVGGLIDSGEQPAVAARRETREEIGVAAPAQSFRPLFRYRITSYHQHYHTHTRVHIYAYTVTLPAHSAYLRLQREEVADAYFLSKRQMKHLLRAHRLQHFGRLMWDYKLFRLAVAYSQLPF